MNLDFHATASRSSPSLQAEVLVIGGGATGTGTALDLALRGFRVVLIEKGALCEGASGRHQGGLHSGGRYSVRDPESARECITENRILRPNAPFALEDTGGIFVVLPEDDPTFADTWVAACHDCGIPVEHLSSAEILRMEPTVNPQILGGFRVPDATLDSFTLVNALATALSVLGGTVLKYHEVIGLRVDGGRVRGAYARSSRTGELVRIDADLVVNAAGAWAGQVSAMAGCQLNVKPNKGSVIAMAYRLVNCLVERCRPPGDGDAVVPAGTVSVFGTTSVPVESPDDTRVHPWEVQKLLAEAEKLVPSVSQARSLRTWAGVRPLYSESSESSREVKRTFVVLDHSERDGVAGLVSVLGGKLCTYRLMAEKAGDQVCRALGTDRSCQSKDFQLPDPRTDSNKSYLALGDRLARIESDRRTDSLICECELVQRSEIEKAARKQAEASGGWNIDDLRRELRLGMGPCQGAFCAFRAAGLVHEAGIVDGHTATSNLVAFAQRRWKGQLPAAWGSGLRQLLLDEYLYQGILGLGEYEVARG